MDDFHCSFCGKRRREVVKLISGPRVFICNECVALCVAILEKEKAAEANDPVADAKDETKEAKPSTEAKSPLRCSFCDKRQSELKVLIAGPQFYICDECVGICVEIIEEEKAAQNPRT